jgi:multiple sugar transport system permease protein
MSTNCRGEGSEVSQRLVPQPRRGGLYRSIAEKVPWYVWWITPAFLILAVITLFPFFWMIVMSTMTVQLAPNKPDLFVGLKNWGDMFTDPSYWQGWGLLIIYVVSCMVLEMGIGISVAFMVNRTKWSGFLSTVFLVPMMVAPVVVGHLFNLLLNSSYGLYAWIMKTVGIYTQGSLLSNPHTALGTIIAMDVWEWTPLIMLLTLAGLKSVPKDTLEASQVDGSSELQVFANVTLPYIMPSLVIAFLLRFMDNMRFIDLILITTLGGPADATKTLSVHLFLKTFQQFKIGMGAAIGFTLLVVIIVCAMVVTNVLLKERTENEEEEEEAVAT